MNFLGNKNLTGKFMWMYHYIQIKFEGVLFVTDNDKALWRAVKYASMESCFLVTTIHYFLESYSLKQSFLYFIC